MNAIAKMPGLLLYKEARTFLEQRKISNPEVFSSRNLYVTVHRVLESYSFRLSTRREILKLFTIQAKLRQSSSSSTSSVANLSPSPTPTVLTPTPTPLSLSPINETIIKETTTIETN